MLKHSPQVEAMMVADPHFADIVHCVDEFANMYGVDDPFDEGDYWMEHEEFMTDADEVAGLLFDEHHNLLPY